MCDVCEWMRRWIEIENEMEENSQIQTNEIKCGKVQGRTRWCSNGKSRCENVWVWNEKQRTKCDLRHLKRVKMNANYFFRLFSSISSFAFTLFLLIRNQCNSVDLGIQNQFSICIQRIKEKCDHFFFRESWIGSAERLIDARIREVNIWIAFTDVSMLGWRVSTNRLCAQSLLTITNIKLKFWPLESK